MRARVLSIGDELLDGSSADTNSSWIAARLVEHGIQVLGIQVVPDVVEDIVDAMSVSVSDADLLIVTGGLGPTPDDVTREAMAVAMGCELVQNPEATSWVAQCLRERGLEPTEGQLSMGCCPAAAAWAPNSAGTAPILHGAVEEAHVWILPGPPREMRMGWHEQVAPSLHVDAASRLWHGHVYSHGLIEAEAADRLGELLDRTNDTVLGTRMSHGIFIVSITAAEERAGRVVQEEVEACLAPYAFEAGDHSLSAAVGRVLRNSIASVAVAESCTGGSIGGMLVATPGSSSWFHGGVTTYTNESKMRELSVSPEHFSSGGDGAVSRSVALEMAEGVRSRFATTWAISVTGIAGPDGGTDEKPVGTVWLAVVGPEGATVRRCRFHGDRAAVQYRTCLSALHLLRLCVLGLEHDVPLIWEQKQ